MDNKTYYLFLDNQQKGPYSKENLQVMYRAGKIDEYTQVWTEDLGNGLSLEGILTSSVWLPQKVHPSVSSHIRATRKNFTISSHARVQHYCRPTSRQQWTCYRFIGMFLHQSFVLPPLFGVIAFILAICAICSCPNKGYAVVTLILSIVFPIIGMVFGVMIMELFAK